MSVAIITGASSGLGTEFFKAVLYGCPSINEIWIVARRTEKLTELAKLAESKKICCFSLDLTSTGDLEKFKILLSENKPEISLFINNAGAGKFGKVWELEPSGLGLDVALNCVAPTILSSAAINYMPMNSAIINVCSIASFLPTPNMTVYSATKSYILAFSRSLREELKPKKINCLAVCPCPMDTEFLDRSGIRGKSKMFEKLPYCKADNVAKKSIKKAFKGKAVYTPKIFYKLYRFLTKIFPHSILIKFSKI